MSIIGLSTMNERLELLIQSAQQSTLPSEESLRVATQLVEEILRSRKIGRAPKGHPLTGVYQEIYDRARQYLLDNLSSLLSSGVSRWESTREWAIALQQQAFRAILDDNQLKRLALEAQKHPPRTELRCHALTQLVEAIRLSGRLARPHRAKFTPQFYDLLYEEAVNKTLTYVCRTIDTYDPERGQNQKFMNWVNFRLDRVLIECRREFREQEIQELPDLNTLEKLAVTDDAESPGESIRECIESDVDQIFQQTHIRDRPQANFRAIALARLAEKSWEEIAAEFSIKVPTLSSFFQRCCDKFAPKFQEYL